MKRYLIASLLAVAALGASPLASARVNLNIGVGLPGVYAAPPVVYQQPYYGAPPVVYGGDGWGGHRDYHHGGDYRHGNGHDNGHRDGRH
jgi:hypothetical protein